MLVVFGLCRFSVRKLRRLMSRAGLVSKALLFGVANGSWLDVATLLFYVILF
jgi:hypothetical protein